MRKIVILLLAFICTGGCQQGESPQQQSSSTAAQPGVPPLRKIRITTSAQVDSLRSRGIEPIVIQPDYVVARLPQSLQQSLSTSGFTVLPVQESDLIQRLIQVVVTSPQQKGLLVELGMDIWQVVGDTVMAQAFDNQIAAARRQGVEVSILESNVKDVIKEQRKEKDDAASKQQP